MPWHFVVLGGPVSGRKKKEKGVTNVEKRSALDRVMGCNGYVSPSFKSLSFADSATGGAEEDVPSHLCVSRGGMVRFHAYSCCSPGISWQVFEPLRPRKRSGVGLFRCTSVG